MEVQPTTVDAQAQQNAEAEPESSNGRSEKDDLLSKAHNFVAKITSSQANPNSKVLHALASMMETQESRYVEESGRSSFSNGRASHNIGRLGNLIRDNDEFFELVSFKFLTESRYSTSVRCAAARLLLACSTTWMYPHVFDESVLENVKRWVMDDKGEADGNNPVDMHMLRTYATGLLAVSLSGGGQMVEDVLTSGLSGKLMRFLRTRVLGEINTSQKDSSFPTESKRFSNSTFSRGREENKGRTRLASDAIRVDVARPLDEGLADDQNIGRDRERSVSSKQAGVMDFFEDSRDETLEESVRDETSRRRGNRAASRPEKPLTSPGSGIRLGGQVRNTKERNPVKSGDSRRMMDTKKDFNKTDADASVTEREENDYSCKEFKVGTKDISDLVMKAFRAAEDEARAANAPHEAVKAAGEAAAELVKTTALEALKNTGDEEAALLAALTAVSTVVDAAKATEVSRESLTAIGESTSTKEPEKEEELEGYVILDAESLAQKMELYCIQCLEKLGEYVEVLGPVLHEKGVDVCLALLHHHSKDKQSVKSLAMLSEVLKLICALAAHRKFASLFVDRGGMQKLLAVQRIPQTFTGLSLCLFAIGSLQAIMERVCALPPDVIHQVVELALQLMECSQDQARKNAALFFGVAFVFRAVLDSFDAQDGLQKMLNLLRTVASVRSGGNSGALGLSNLGALRNDRGPNEVLTAAEKQIAYHTCVALRQYLRAHLLLLVDSLRPNKNRSAGRNIPSARAVYKPLDISNEAMDAVFLQLQRDRKLGPAFVRARWPVVQKFLDFNGHTILLELCQAPPADRYLHDLAQYALDILQLVTLVPNSRKAVVTATLSNERVGMAVILDSANGAAYADPEVIQPALNILVNLVCPPPSLSNKPLSLTQSQTNAQASLPTQNERNGEQAVTEPGGSAPQGPATGNSSQSSGPSVASGVVGDRRISLGPGHGCAGLATTMEQGYRQAREAVRANNGIKVLLHLLHPRVVLPPASLDCIRALACRVLLGLARDDVIAHILTKLQVGKLLSELIRDSGSQAPGMEHGRWQVELSQVAMELIAIVTNSGRASTIAATDAAAPTLKRIERAAIAAATPITYHSRELLLLIHEHLQASGLNATAAALLKEAQLTPLPYLSVPTPVLHQTAVQENLAVQFQWPSGHVSGGFLSGAPKPMLRIEDSGPKVDMSASGSKKKSVSFSPIFSCQAKTQTASQQTPGSKSVSRASNSKNLSLSSRTPEVLSAPLENSRTPIIENLKTPILLPMKRKLTDRESASSSPAKRFALTDSSAQSPVVPTPNLNSRKVGQISDASTFPVTPSSTHKNFYWSSSTPNSMFLDNSEDSTPGLFAEPQPPNTERATLDSLVVQYLKHQHRQCPAPITTLPPISLLHPHVCPESSKSLDAPVNLAARLGTREFRTHYGGMHGHRRDRHYIFSRFRPWRTCRDESVLLTCITFLGNASRVATGCHTGELKVFDSNSGNLLESHHGHQSLVTLVQSTPRADDPKMQLILSSGTSDVRLWDSSALSSGPLSSFEGCKAARFSHGGTVFGAVSAESARREVLLYDVQTFNLEQKLTDTSVSPPVRGHVQSIVHFNPSDTMLLWNGILWDRRTSGPVHRFDQFSDYGGGGFHPAGNEVIINSEVWDLRKFRLLRSVPSLDQTIITFNSGGDIIYAILRRNLEDITSAAQPRRVRHPLFAAFRTIDAVSYLDIATVPVDRCVLDFATEPTDSFVGVVAMDDHEEMYASARIYEVGRRRPTDDDSDPDDGAESDDDDDEDEDEDEDDDGADDDALVGPGGLGGDDDDDDGDDDDEELEEGDLFSEGDDGDFDEDGIGGGILDIGTDDDDDEESQLLESFSSDDEGSLGRLMW
ncbi:hypothetical protein AMTRI_Chr11g155380 [Amborella trichopoda]|uniref:LisH domain-containing protein n=1 Tax=Amborella trichopoda TaxID=13333 RepID=W1PN22_AMBTC|nr:DDB1- and CUL4-associated factor homolog 1 [Amborella trichopoda]ERN08575.1 hypothetical protein AMTR_s00017p00130610 [Amborella trichopoda]|eukprot:XP_006846994.1 DDB1- and CUL4-associated factor homolog 1 [Amborella trichopoda]